MVNKLKKYHRDIEVYSLYKRTYISCDDYSISEKATRKIYAFYNKETESFFNTEDFYQNNNKIYFWKRDIC